MRVNKYGNQKVKAFGKTFDSKKEYQRWCELKYLERAGKISHLERQVSYELQPSFKYHGRTQRAITYIADFKYIEDGIEVVEDVKSEITKKNPVYVIKKKMMMYVYGIEIREV